MIWRNEPSILVDDPNSGPGASLPCQGAFFFQSRDYAFGASLRASEVFCEPGNASISALSEEVERPCSRQLFLVCRLGERQDRIPDHIQHELDESFARSDGVGFRQSLVIARLSLPDRAFYGKPCKRRSPFPSKKGWQNSNSKWKMQDATRGCMLVFSSQPKISAITSGT